MLTIVGLGILPTACKRSTDAPVLVAAVDFVAPVNDAITDAVEGITFTFPGAAAAAFSEPSLAGQTAALTFNNPDTGPTTTTVNFTSATGASTGSFTANVTYGSCVFAVAASSFPTGHRLSTGQIVTVNPCNIRLGTQGAPADGVARARAAVFILGAAASTGTTVTVTVNPGGSITVNGRDVGTVTLVPVSG